MHADELMFFNTMPQILPLYEALRSRLLDAYPEVQIKISKTQISFRNRYVFAMASLPWRKVKGWPEEYLLVSFGLARERLSPRIVQAVEAAPGRWTHHVLVQQPQEIDAELLGWLREAYEFSLRK